MIHDCHLYTGEVKFFLFCTRSTQKSCRQSYKKCSSLLHSSSPPGSPLFTMAWSIHLLLTHADLETPTLARLRPRPDSLRPWPGPVAGTPSPLSVVHGALWEPLFKAGVVLQSSSEIPSNTRILNDAMNLP